MTDATGHLIASDYGDGFAARAIKLHAEGPDGGSDLNPRMPICSGDQRSTMRPSLHPNCVYSWCFEEAPSTRAGACGPGGIERGYFFVLLLSITVAHFPSGCWNSILNVYAVGESSLMVTRDLTFLPRIMLSSS
jgi:hypothetical protein